jgi:hypothetical protein
MKGADLPLIDPERFRLFFCHGCSSTGCQWQESCDATRQKETGRLAECAEISGSRG